MKKVLDKLTSKAVLAICIGWLLTLTITHLWPASYWLEVNSVHVADSQANKPVVMYVDRKIHRDFIGIWGVTVRSIQDTGVHIACASSALSDYKEGTKLPEVVTLGWWTNGKCETLPVGVYIVQTTWQIQGNGFFPTKIVSQTSNPFKITEG